MTALSGQPHYAVRTTTQVGYSVSASLFHPPYIGETYRLTQTAVFEGPHCCIPVAGVGEVAEEHLALRRTPNPALVQLQVLFRRTDEQELLPNVPTRFFNTFSLAIIVFVAFENIDGTPTYYPVF